MDWDSEVDESGKKNLSFIYLFIWKESYGETATILFKRRKINILKTD
jgi:hypothetical protein